MYTLIFDGGNSLIKAKTTSGEVAFPHALQEITKAEYEQILTRAGQRGPGFDYLQINGKYYVVGESAERHGTLTRQTGASRYTPEYYGVLVAASLARLYQNGGEVEVFGSHPPGDIVYRDDLMDAALQTFHVMIGDSERNFEVVWANTFDEPLGGLMNVLLTEDGTGYQRTDINGGYALVLDIGGHTTDFLGVKPGGQVDYGLNVSVPIGITQAVKDFERSIKATHREAFKSTATLRPDRVRQALMTGEFQGGGRTYPCEFEANEAVSALLNRIGQAYQEEAGGSANWDSIILTGGGSAMLLDRLTPMLDHDRIILAEDQKSAHMANVRGGQKLRRLYRKLGIS